MSEDESKKVAALYKRIHSEVSDDLDEELELELDDDRGAESIDGTIDHPPALTKRGSSTSRSCCACSGS